MAALLFPAGSPLAYISEQLMTRHCIEGLVLALMSLYMFTRCLNKPAIGAWAASVGCYLLAVTCKEVYVPLVLLLPFIPRGPVRARLRLLYFAGLMLAPFRWKLGPWREGEFRLISSSVGNLPLPPEGFLPATSREMETSFAAPFIVKYTSPEGWAAYSPELSLDIAPDGKSAQLIWGLPRPD